MNILCVFPGVKLHLNLHFLNNFQKNISTLVFELQLNIVEKSNFRLYIYGGNSITTTLNDCCTYKTCFLSVLFNKIAIPPYFD